MTMIKTPKLLPWYACKAGVSTERATVLWKRAVREATERTGWVGNDAYWGETMHTFLALLEREKSSFCAPRVTPLVRSQNRIWRLPLTAMEDMLCAMSANWHRQFNHPRRAA
jgi:maltooligosyltrehalose synthase